MAPFKQVCVKNSTCDWVEEDILNDIKARDDNLKYESTKSVKNLIKKRNEISSHLS